MVVPIDRFFPLQPVVGISPASNGRAIMDVARNETTCASAAESGHLPIIQWLKENGYPLDEWTCSFAARRGKLPILQWARENGYSWD